MDAFNLIKEVSELLYYWVGIAGLITIYIAIKNNRQVKIEREELRKEKEQVLQEKRDEVIRNFRIEIYPEFQKSIGANRKVIPVGFNLIDYFNSKKISEEMRKSLVDSISDDEIEKMKKYINIMNELIEKMDKEKIDEAIADKINEMFQYCIYQCVELKVHENYKKLFNFVYEYNKEKMDNANK